MLIFKIKLCLFKSSLKHAYKLTDGFMLIVSVAIFIYRYNRNKKYCSMYTKQNNNRILI